MSLSDCVDCWETPCVCGHGYKDYSIKRRIELASAVLGVDKMELTKFMSERGSAEPSQPVAGQSSIEIPDGYKLMLVTNFDELMECLFRADEKGYMPFAMQDDWDKFNFQSVTTANAGKDSHD